MSTRRDLRKLASESLIYGIPGIALRFLSGFLVPLYTRIFSPAEYGIVGLVTSTVSLVSIVAILALDNSAYRWYYDTDDVVDRKTTYSTWTWAYLAVTTVICVCIVAASNFLARTILGSAVYADIFQVAALTLPLAVLGAVMTSWLRVQRRAWASVVTTIVVSVLTILATVVLVVYLDRGIAGVFLGQLAGSIGAVVMAIALMRGWLLPRWFRWSRLRVMLKYGLPLIPAAVGYWVVNLADRYFIARFGSTRDVGLYTVANAIAAVTFLATSAFQTAWGPFAFSIHREPHAKTVYARVLLGYAWLACLWATAVSIFAPEVIRILATPRYAGAAVAVPTLSFSYVMYGAYYIAAIGPGIVKTTRPVGAAVTLAACVNILLNLLLIPTWGIVGAGVSTLISFTVMPAYLFIRSQALYPIPYRFGPVLALVAFGLSFSAIVERWQPATLWLGVLGKLALLGLFVPAAFLFRFITLDEARALLRRNRQGAAPEGS